LINQINEKRKDYTFEFEKSISAFCNWSLEKNSQGKYIDNNTQYAWEEFFRINCQNFNVKGKTK
jgi:hypothetical protein